MKPYLIKMECQLLRVRFCFIFKWRFCNQWSLPWSMKYLCWRNWLVAYRKHIPQPEILKSKAETKNQAEIKDRPCSENVLICQSLGLIQKLHNVKPLNINTLQPPDIHTYVCVSGGCNKLIFKSFALCNFLNKPSLSLVRGIFKTLSDIYDGGFLQKYSICDVRQDP